MKSIRILTNDFDLQAEIDNYESLQFTRSWHGLGDFEMHINQYKKDVDQILKGRFVVLQDNKVGIIRHKEIPLDQKGKASENWTIKGFDLKSIIAQRITEPPSTAGYDSISGDAETVIKHYVDTHLVNPVNPDRKMPNLVIAPNQNRGSHISWQSRLKNVAEEIENISLISGLGWGVYLDYENQQLVFDVFEGKDLTASQTVNPPVILSPEFESIKTQSFVDSDLNMKNFAYVGGQGEGVEREIIHFGDTTGYDRFETFIDARDIETTSELTERGQQKLEELKTEMYLEGQIQSPVTRTQYKEEHDSFVGQYQPIGKVVKETKVVSTFAYEQDYDLGDIITMQNRSWGVTVDTRITELKEIYEPSGFVLEAVFGQNRPTLISKIKKELSQFDNELKR